jgi:hypothetical protein
MVRYPISIPRYNGRDPAKLSKAAERDRSAQRIEQYINKEMEECTEERRVFSYGGIAFDLKIPEPDVADILYDIDCGGNGITVSRK